MYRSKLIALSTAPRTFALAISALFLVLSSGTPGTAAEPSCCGPISVRGYRLQAVLDGMDVESLWLAHEHVNWETGAPDKGPDYDGPGRSTHCSAFAAALAKKLGVYMLRPPDHGQILLANAQTEWFRTEKGRQAGWRCALEAPSRYRLWPMTATWLSSPMRLPIRTNLGTSPSCVLPQDQSGCWMKTGRP